MPEPGEAVHRIGVLKKWVGQRAADRWAPTAGYLSRTIPGHRFEVVTLGFDAVAGAVANQRVDFLLANPAIYVDMAERFGASRLVTLRNRAGDKELTRFGGVVFTRADNDSVRDLADLRERTFMAVEPGSLGGYRMAQRLLEAQGVSTERLKLSFGGAQDAVVEAVAAGWVAAGTVRTGTLERMAAEGRIDLDRLRVLHPRSVPGFPLRVSTRLYPEWPFARLAHTESSLARQVAVALLEMPVGSPAAASARSQGWTVPAGYGPVHDLMAELRIGPYERPGPFGVTDVLRKYWYWVAAGAAVVGVLVLVTMGMLRLNRRIQASRRELEEARDRLEERVAERSERLAASERKYREIINGTREGFWLLDAELSIREVNRALCRMLGYAPEELVGCTPFDFVAPETRRILEVESERIQEVSGQSYELTLLTRRGRRVAVLVQATPFREEQDGDPYIGAFLTDLTAFKQVEASLQQANRILQALSRSNRTLLYAENEQDLFEEICRTAVDAAGYPLAWIGLAEGGGREALRGMARAGESPGILDRLGKAVGDPGECPALTALQRGEAVLFQDLPNHPHAPAWAAEAGADGLGALVALPFSGEGFEGALVIFAHEPFSFDREEIRLLSELASDLAMGVGQRRIRTERERHLQRLRQSAVVFDSSGEGVIIADPNERIVAVNRAFTVITGYTEEEVLGHTPRLLSSGTQGPEFYQNLWRKLRDEDAWQGEIWNRRKTGEVYPEHLTITAVRDEAGTLTNYVAVFADITEMKRSREELDFLANHDPLTELPNRRLFHERLGHALDQRDPDGECLAVLMLDLDDFKSVNDSLGHPVGDELLVEAAKRLGGVLHREDTLARIGGDEFLVLLEYISGPLRAERVAQDLLDAFEEPMHLEGREVSLSASIGISLYPQDGADGATLIKNADAALFRAKELGRNQCRFYTRELTATATERLSLARELETAIENDELELHYQPKVELHSGRICGAEALLRWRHPERGLVSPGRFIPLAEETGLVLPMGDWVLEQACAQQRRWRDAGIHLERLAVNLSTVQLQRRDIPGLLQRISADFGCPFDCLELEVTEASLMEDTDEAARILAELGDMGIQLALDDFGTGYSSLGYLKNLPLDTLKIDKSFVCDIPGDLSDMALVRTILAMGKSLGMRVVAEGVESEEQAELLRREGCEVGQGFLYAPALPGEELAELLRAPEGAFSRPVPHS
ncbi:EAL domain-containing protein [Thiohalorhabdus sp. Cl-TMA]|uniref:EAL domain-containing protein n=1 Tax=Thiohalorhabdus methylotrophus TaxID=3242694 RepID=A0ABV4TSH4_9GAMM